MLIMPLNTGVYRNGKLRKDIPWNGGTGNIFERNQVAEAVLNVFLTTAMKEGDPDLLYHTDADGTEHRFRDLEEGKFVDIASTGVYYIETQCPLWKVGRQVLERDHKYFEDSEYEITFRAGDELRMWRDSK